MQVVLILLQMLFEICDYEGFFLRQRLHYRVSEELYEDAVAAPALVAELHLELQLAHFGDVRQRLVLRELVQQAVHDMHEDHHFRVVRNHEVQCRVIFAKERDTVPLLEVT